MSFFASDFTQTCHLVIKGKADRWGRKATDAEMYLPCSYTFKESLSRGKRASDQYEGSAQVIVASTVDVEVGDVMQLLPDNREYTIVRIIPIDDFDDTVDATRLILE